MAMIKIDDEMTKNNLKSKMLLQVLLLKKLLDQQKNLKKHL